MSSKEFAELKEQVDKLLKPSLTKHDWARAMGVSIASLHRYLDESEGSTIPDDVARLLKALHTFLKNSEVESSKIREALKATGVAGVVARAASAGLLPPSTVSLLASTPSLIWMGALGGAVGAIVGAGALGFFQKVKPAPDANTTPDNP